MRILPLVCVVGGSEFKVKLLLRSSVKMSASMVIELVISLGIQLLGNHHIYF